MSKCNICDDEKNHLVKEPLDKEKFNKYFDEFSNYLNHQEARTKALELVGYKWVRCSRCEKNRIDYENIDTIFPVEVSKNTKCRKCNNDYKCSVIINMEDIIDSSTYERNMGTEVQFNYEKIVDCKFCCNEILLEGTIVEYPIGALNYAD